MLEEAWHILHKFVYFHTSTVRYQGDEFSGMQPMASEHYIESDLKLGLKYGIMYLEHFHNCFSFDHTYLGFLTSPLAKSLTLG